MELNSDNRDFSAMSLISSLTEKVEHKTVQEFYMQPIASFKGPGRQGNALVYKDSYNSIRTFTKGKMNILFNDIDVNWLNEYEKWLREKKCAKTSISLSFRTLRSVYNKAIKAKFVRRDLYPFNEFKISKFDTTTKKRAISKNIIIDIQKLDLTKERYYVQFSRDIFIFSYLCGGINFTDIAHLTNENISDKQMSYIRKKTKKKINIPLQKNASEIIQKYQQNNSVYVFPILNLYHVTEVQKYNRIHKVMGKVNKALKEISKIAGVDINITSYTARHSYATVLKNSGVNIALIGETLGHSDLKITQIYLDSFENGQIDAAMKNLL